MKSDAEEGMEAVVTIGANTGDDETGFTLRRLAAVVADSNDAVAVLDLDGRILAWNPAAARLYGYAEREALQLRWTALVPTSEHAQALALLQAVARGEEVRALEVARIVRDGRPLRVSLTMSVLRDDQGRPVGVATTERDLTRLEPAESALRMSEERYRSLFEHMSEGLAYCRMLFEGDRPVDFVYLDVNPAFEALTGLRGAVGKKVSELIPGILESDPALIERYGRVARSGTPDKFETYVESLGQWFDISAYCPAQGDFVAVFDVITERKRAEEELRASSERMRVAQEALSEADRQKNHFLAMLSHELRNPLAPIRNGLYILEHAAPGGEQAQRAQAIIHRQIAQMTWLIDELLDVTRIAHGKIKLQRERLDLNQLMHRTIEDQRAIFARGDVRLEVLPAPGEVWVDGDRVRLAQVIGNLLQNAAKFTPHGGQTTVRVEVSPERRQAVLTVQDTGAGIRPEMLPRLFHAFVQADTSLDRREGGLGLGLALVKGLVELHGGSVSATSEGLGKGAAFTVTLPLDATPAELTPASSGLGAAEAPHRVLVIEDNEDAADTLREVLEFCGHTVEVAHTGRQGIAKAEVFSPDIVLCDIGLPEMDGYEVARTLRAHPQLGRVPLVAVSGYARPEDVDRAMAAGFDLHLAKPPGIDAIERAIASAATKRPGGH